MEKSAWQTQRGPKNGYINKMKDILYKVLARARLFLTHTMMGGEKQGTGRRIWEDSDIPTLLSTSCEAKGADFTPIKGKKENMN